MNRLLNALHIPQKKKKTTKYDSYRSHHTPTKHHSYRSHHSNESTPPKKSSYSLNLGYSDKGVYSKSNKEGFFYELNPGVNPGLGILKRKET
jgi:hypothetical protein